MATDEAFWDGMYSEGERVWSGAPNGSLVAELEGTPAGRALDVGCGEGADAIWLARQGWSVTGIDISSVAVQRARDAAASAGVSVDWIHGDPLGTPFDSDSFDLVSLQYFPLPHQAGKKGVRRLLSTVAPGGTLLMVAHNLTEEHKRQHGHGEGPDLTRMYEPEEVAELLDDRWIIDTYETRERPNVPEGTPHVDDVILRARRAG
ncbi:class I SAM-dependent methyltransferase [Lipingzhangella sp. LS1_29]|uniref:Class I SAM-dependent methyltransferase n=1 Tax=Lipingzhangella rawalii TaxID=2055835 RepID=A0ABU2HB88_9ACTN|nr:class I SAM-dependent methyltransferase [Lipingzhangella rawalii]MDS1272252.1 class I SAM-dependent methyltransferase [Lipingzhangella rawalii]